MKKKRRKHAEQEIDKIINKLKRIIENDIKNRDFDVGLKHLVCLKDIELMFYYSYRDDDFENYINQISRLMFQNAVSFVPEFNNVIFIDSLSWDYHGLTQQYLRAMMSMNLKIEYIVLGKPAGYIGNRHIIQELYDYRNAQIVCIPSSMTNEQQIRLLHEKICGFRPFKVFLHSFDVLDCIALLAVGSAVKLRIDLGDHHCWCGIDVADFIIGFRNWGLTLCNTVRMVNQNKLINLPYYPVLNDNVEFSEFPEFVKGKVLIYSGGALYKIIDEDMTFLKMMHRIITENKNALILFSCRDKDDSLLRKYIVNNNLSNRIILIGYRKDLARLLDHIDIYLNTYPFGGGLMVQYAISKGIPILSITKNIDTIEYLNFSNIGYSYQTEYNDMDDLFQEANKLINDREYRLTIGGLIKEHSPSEKRFNKSFDEIYNGKYKNIEDNLSDNPKKYDFEMDRRKFAFSNLSPAILALPKILFKTFSIKMFGIFPYFIVINGCVNWLVGKTQTKISDPINLRKDRTQESC